MKQGSAERMNALLQQAVRQELQWDPLVEEAHIGADAENDTVILWGTVGSWAQRHAAATAAHRVTGVLDVVNSIAVEPPGSSARKDRELARALRSALIRNVSLPEARIKSTVSGGVVTLEGDVDSRRQLTEAERTVRAVAGVYGVVNLLQVETTDTGTTTAGTDYGCATGALGSSSRARRITSCGGTRRDVQDGRGQGPEQEAFHAPSSSRS